jgi:hypothetical protein
MEDPPPHINTEKNTIKCVTTTEPIPNNLIKQKLNKNNIVTNQDHAKENTHLKKLH